ncbi:MAG: non-hydrolyzing UDP-N-acetylglucosamine 2-epimerase [Patescibacteria group bacterium]
MKHKTKKIVFILGTRPEIIKLYPLITFCQKKHLPHYIVHTNQHYDRDLDQVFFKELKLKPAKYNLQIGSGQQGDQTGRMLIEIEKVLIADKPDLVIVQGDTNTTLAGALASVKLNIPIAHIEAGLRSYDRSMPEEHNRIITDHISDYLFCPTNLQKQILQKENISSKKIDVVGNTIVDSVNMCIALARKNSLALSKYNLETNNYFLLTCHRPSNTDNSKNFQTIIDSIAKICQQENLKCIFPVHPRLNKHTKELKKIKNFIITKPLGYLDLLQLQKNSRLIFTDSGGIQEESCILHKKCLILRENTERPETVKVGGAILLSKISSSEIIKKYNLLIRKKINWSNPFGNKPSQKIISKIF